MSLPAGRQVMSNREPSGFRRVLCYATIPGLSPTNCYLLFSPFGTLRVTFVSRLPTPYSCLYPLSLIISNTGRKRSSPSLTR